MISVLIVGDIRLYRDGLAHMLDRVDGVRVLGTADHGQQALEQVPVLRPDVVLIDKAMPESLAAIRAIATSHPDVKLVALAVSETEREVVACAEAGVVGYVPRHASLEDLVSTLESVNRGELRCSPRIAATLLRRVAALSAERAPGVNGIYLTPRELEITGLIDRGLTNKQIAKELGIEPATVKNHVHNILDKLHVHHRGEAAARMRGRLPRLSVGP